MSIFGAYSNYYNLLYKDKDYAAETEYIHNLIQRNLPEAVSILDLGCGTGRHDLFLASKGYKIYGVDRSEEMLTAARSHVAPPPSSLTFQQGDIRTVKLERTFDVIISIFHVMSYQTSNSDLKNAFITARNHLKPGGLFIFDFWYGPAVLTDRPAVRTKRLEDEIVTVIRIAEPVMHANENLVDVNYRICIHDKATGIDEEIQETHRMRYLFRPELELLLQESGMSIITMTEWMTGKEPGFDTWGVCCVARG